MNFQNVAAVSGGRTSGLMLKRLLDAHPDYRARFLTLFCNTGKERNETLDFVYNMQTSWGVPITWLEYTRVPAVEVHPEVFPSLRRQKNHQELIDKGEKCHWFRVVTYETARRNGDAIVPFDELLTWAKALPNVRTRTCSVQLKVRTMERYLFSLGIHSWSDHIGIRADEAHRTIQILANAPSYTAPKFPLVDAGISVRDVAEFWRTNDFDLRLDSEEGNCDLCFLKRKAKLVRLAKKRPESIAWWKNAEERFAITANGDGKFFRLGQPYSLIEHLALNPHPELTFNDTEQDIPCSCAERAYDPTED